MTIDGAPHAGAAVCCQRLCGQGSLSCCTCVFACRRFYLFKVLTEGRPRCAAWSVIVCSKRWVTCVLHFGHLQLPDSAARACTCTPLPARSEYVSEMEQKLVPTLLAGYKYACLLRPLLATCMQLGSRAHHACMRVCLICHRLPVATAGSGSRRTSSTSRWCPTARCA